MAAQRRDVALRQNAAFADDQLADGNAGQEIDRGPQRHGEAAQVAVIDADQRSLELEGAVQLGPVVYLHQHVHAVVERACLESRKAGVFQRGDDQEDRIGAERARLRDLIFVDDEFLAQRRQCACVASIDQIFRSALEKRPVRRAEAGIDLPLVDAAIAEGSNGSPQMPRLGLDHSDFLDDSRCAPAIRCRIARSKSRGAAARARRPRSRRTGPRGFGPDDFLGLVGMMILVGCRRRDPAAVRWARAGFRLCSDN